MLRPALVWHLSLALAATASWFAPAWGCPLNCIHVPAGVDYCTPAAQIDTSIVDPTYNCGGYEAAFSIPHGTLHSVAWSPFGVCRPQTTVEDDFVVGGLPDGTVVSLTARLELSLTGSNYMGPGNAFAGLVEGTFNSSRLDWDLAEFYGNTRETVLSVPVTAIAGTPFHMRYFVGATLGELCYASWDGSFVFVDVPADASVISCNGYVQAPVPALPTSWGKLKARYRGGDP